MNPYTGAIATFESTEDAHRAGHTVALSEPEAKQLYGLNRHDRRAELSRMRAEAKRLARAARR